MKRRILATLIMTTLSTASWAQCTGSNGAMHLPILQMQTSSWTGGILVNNVSDEDITVKISYTDHNGQSFSGSYQYFANFSASNTPASTSGANLSPGTLGRIHYNNNGNRYLSNGKITWYSDACIDEAITVAYYNQMSQTSRYDGNLFYLNDAQPF